MRKNIVMSVLVAGSVLVGSMAFAGNPNQSGQSNQSSQSSQSSQIGKGGHCGHCGQHKPSLAKKISQSFKKGYQAGHKAGTKAFDSIQNKVMDTGVAVKKAVTGKKCKTFVKGHYDKNGKHTKGHFRKVKCNKPCQSNKTSQSKY